jgi:hypothetical protein
MKIISYILIFFINKINHNKNIIIYRIFLNNTNYQIYFKILITTIIYIERE